jgi:predicted transposase
VKQTLPVKLAPTPAQHAALLATMERFNLACDWIAGEAFRDRCANKIELQKTVYYPVRKRFGLAAQLTVRAISKTVEAYKRDKDVQPRFRPHGAVPYDERIMSFKGVEAVSLLALDGRQVVPMRFGAYQAARIDRRRGQADLVYRDGVFYLYVTIDTPEPPVGEAADYLGIDFGIVNLATDSDGTVYSGDAVESKRRTYAHRRRNLQRKGTHAARRKLRRIAGHQARYQADCNHVISKAVVRHREPRWHPDADGNGSSASAGAPGQLGVLSASVLPLLRGRVGRRPGRRGRSAQHLAGVPRLRVRRQGEPGQSVVVRLWRVRARWPKRPSRGAGHPHQSRRHAAEGPGGRATCRARDSLPPSGGSS